MLHLCVSDVNSAMLVRAAGLVPCLLHALFLESDADHPRRGMDEAIRAGVQRDGVECVLQIALSGAGRALLLQHPEALEALRVLRGTALTAEARHSAGSALVALGVAAGLSRVAHPPGTRLAEMIGASAAKVRVRPNRRSAAHPRPRRRLRTVARAMSCYRTTGATSSLSSASRPR